MENRGPTGGFIIALAALGVILAAAVYQVPQPVRGFIVAFVLVMLSLGSFVMRLVSQYLQYKAVQLSTGATPGVHRKKARRDESARSLDKLRIIHGTAGVGKRNIIR